MHPFKLFIKSGGLGGSQRHVEAEIEGIICDNPGSLLGNFDKGVQGSGVG